MININIYKIFGSIPHFSSSTEGAEHKITLLTMTKRGFWSAEFLCVEISTVTSTNNSSQGAETWKLRNYSTVSVAFEFIFEVIFNVPISMDHCRRGQK